MQYNVKGYHGTIKSSSDSIYVNGFDYHQYDINDFESERVPNDLGFGIYFFIDNEKIRSQGFKNAKNYAEKYVKKENIDKVTIVVADLNFNSHRFLNLDESDNQEYFLHIMKNNETAANMIWSKTVKGEHKKRKIFDGIFIEMLIDDIEEQMDETIQGVQKDTFSSLGSARRSNFHNTTEIAVREIDCIKINRVS